MMDLARADERHAAGRNDCDQRQNYSVRCGGIHDFRPPLVLNE
jgi:hypothetical protein